MEKAITSVFTKTIKKASTLMLLLFLASQGVLFSQTSLTSGVKGGDVNINTPEATGALMYDLGPANYAFGIGCASPFTTTENDHFRNWIVPGPQILEFTDVSIIIAEATAAGADIEVFIYTNAGGPFPGGVLTEIAASGIVQTAAAGTNMQEIPVTATGVANPGDEVVIKVHYPDDPGISFRLGYGDDEGETTWLLAPDCGATTITAVDALGFPEDLMMILFANEATPVAAIVPTMGEWGIMILGITFLIVGVVAVRYRRRETVLVRA